MLNIENLKALGADTDEGLARCLNNKDFYLRMVSMVLADDGFERLEKAIEENDLKEAFERAHALKGTLGNVSLKPLLAPVSEMTEELRAEKDIDYAPYIEKMKEELSAFRGLLTD